MNLIVERIDYHEIAKKVLIENGQYLYGTLDDEPIEIDSLTFISIVVGVENELSINVSDSLLIDYPKTFNEYVTFIELAVEVYANSKNGEDKGGDADTYDIIVRR